MVHEMRRMPPDIVSRVLSIFSLIIALGAIALLLLNFRLKDNRDELQMTFEQHLAANAHEFTKTQSELERKHQAALDKHVQSIDAWNSQLNAAVESFRSDANTLLSQIEDDNRLSEQQRLFSYQAVLKDLESRLAAMEPPLDLSKHPDSATEASDQVSDPADLLPEISSDDAIASSDTTSLRLVTSSLRPSSEQVTLVVLENLSDEPTEIQSVRFRPMSRFPLSLDSDPVKSAIRISFSPSDNTSTKPGYHGVYAQDLETPVVIPAGQRTTLRFTITDPQHNGWGFAGSLLLGYNDQESLAIDSGRVIFTP